MPLSLKLRPNKAFTLLELIITIAVIAIAAAFAVPQFARTIEATRAQEAVASLRQIRTAERAYRMMEDGYWGPSSGSGVSEIREINEALNLNLNLSNEREWDYSITIPRPNTFRAIAERIDGIYPDGEIYIDQDGRFGANNWPLPLPEE